MQPRGELRDAGAGGRRAGRAPRQPQDHRVRGLPNLPAPGHPQDLPREQARALRQGRQALRGQRRRAQGPRQLRRRAQRAQGLRGVHGAGRPAGGRREGGLGRRLSTD